MFPGIFSVGMVLAGLYSLGITDPAMPVTRFVTDRLASFFRKSILLPALFAVLGAWNVLTPASALIGQAADALGYVWPTQHAIYLAVDRLLGAGHAAAFGLFNLAMLLLVAWQAVRAVRAYCNLSDPPAFSWKDLGATGFFLILSLLAILLFAPTQNSPAINFDSWGSFYFVQYAIFFVLGPTAAFTLIGCAIWFRRLRPNIGSTVRD